MKRLRRVVRPRVIAALVIWTVGVLVLQTFKGAGVGGLRCLKDPTCGEIGWIPPAAWAIGFLVILGIAYIRRARDA